MKDSIAAVETQSKDGEITYNHPAYGQISASRVQYGGTGGGIALYGSEFKHTNVVLVKITGSKMYRSLSRDWHHEGPVIVELALSESGWATFVSALNQGSGIPATIQFSEKDGYRPGIELRQTKSLYDQEGLRTIADVVAQLDILQGKLDEAGLSKKKADDLRKHIDKARQQIKLNLPYVEKSFGSHMETMVDQGKLEIDAYVQAAIARAGNIALAQQLTDSGGTITPQLSVPISFEKDKKA